MRRQKYLSISAMIAYITFINMFIPLSTDLYLPALPEMGNYFSASEFLVGLTLTIFFFVFAVSMVLFGPLSDKFGRRPILIFGAAIYTAASFACAVSANIYFLLAGRFFQAIGSGAVITVSTALIKDCFRGQVMRKILAITQALGVIAPMVAPLVGGVLLTFTDWRGSFYLLTILGTINLIVAFLFCETLPEHRRYQGEILNSLTLLAEVAREKYFMAVLIMFAFLSKPYMAYLSASSFIYVEHFNLTAQEYSYFFAVNSAASIAGPILYLKLKNNLSNISMLRLCFFVAMTSGILVLTIGQSSAVMFLLAFLPFTVIGAVARPFSMEILLMEAKENVGTAASIINFVPTLFGSLGMMLGTLPWSNFINGLGMIMTTATTLSILLWILIRCGKFGSARQSASDLT
ncbi:MAG: Bcr/CflA family efflux MFS transporter [Selenomonadaceae bacterium]|nr:Bcr/CflA family efflux MFS transporter [Selenomonadaceae bacterium]